LTLQRFVAGLAGFGAIAFGVSACGSSNNSASSTSTTAAAQKGGTINGAGATFPQPIYSEWAARFKQAQGTTVNYQAIGSGGGIAQFTAGTVDFGATDSAMKDAEMKAAEKKGTPVHVPTVLGAVTVSYKVQGVANGLKLDGATIADIFLGKIKSWDDSAIKKLNSGVTLPGTAITVCHRSDESGTTANFTKFLAAYSPAWAKGPGTDKSVKWPTGTGAKGNDGVAGCVKQSDGAVGYVEQAFALQNNFTTAAVKNKAGNYIEPSLAATSAAAAGVTPPADLRFSTIDAKGAQAYPIAAITFLLVYQDMCKAGISKEKAGLVKDWLNYAEGGGQAIAPELKYAPLPDAIKSKAQAKVDGLQCSGAAIAG
jgi:phosphate transport system substrate-binding protein